MSNPRIQATRNESRIIGMSNPRIRATRNESRIIGMSNPRIRATRNESWMGHKTVRRKMDHKMVGKSR